MPLTQRAREQLGEEILHEVHGLGPIEPLMRDPDVCDILVNTARQVYVERNGKLELTPVVFRDSTHLLQIIDRIVSRVGRRIDESSPMVDARLPDGSRVNAIIPPLALDGPLLSIRRFGRDPLHRERPGRPRIAHARDGRRPARDGAGAAQHPRLGRHRVRQDDAAQLPVVVHPRRRAHRHHRGLGRAPAPAAARVPLETRPANIEGRGEITQRDLLRNTLRMRPDRIIVGECRGAETLDMLQAMNTGHDGSISTVHANSPRDALSRLETMIQMARLRPAVEGHAPAGQPGPRRHRADRAAGRRHASGDERDARWSAWRATPSCSRSCSPSSARAVEDGRIVGRLVSTGIRPRFAERVKASSHEVDADGLRLLEGGSITAHARGTGTL